MRAMWVWVFMPHADNDVVPWMADTDEREQAVTSAQARNLHSLVVKELREVVHDALG